MGDRRDDHRAVADEAANGAGDDIAGAGPVLLLWIGLAHGWLWVALGLFAFLSMFRRPLLYFARRGLGLPVELPPDLRK